MLESVNPSQDDQSGQSLLSRVQARSTWQLTIVVDKVTVS
jgi:hypothetical protein